MSDARPTSQNDARSARTKMRIIEAAIEVFGRRGFEAASLRDLAIAAEVNQPAIADYFGSKRGLYLAAVEHIASYANDVFQAARTPEGMFPDGVSRLRHELCEAAQTILAEDRPHGWEGFVARCAQENGEACKILRARAVAPLAHRMASYVCPEPADPDVVDECQARVMAMFTAIVSFGLLKGIVSRASSWPDPDPRHANRLISLIDELCRNDLLSRPASPLKAAR